MAENTSPIQIYIENANAADIGGFTIPLPTTREAIAPWLTAIEVNGFEETDIAIQGVQSSVPGLEEILRDMVADGISFDELNYLAAKISGLEEWRKNLFAAALEADYHCKNIQDLMNLPENTIHLDLQPAFGEEQYGDFLIDTARDNTAEVFDRLEQSDDPVERELAQHILRLERHVDVRLYGREVVVEENGIFTNQGYFADRGTFQESYRGPEDIPLEYRVFSAPQPPLMAVDVDVPTFLAELHAIAGSFSRDAERNISVLSKLRSAEYLFLMDGNGAFLTEAMHAYRQGTDAFDRWMNTTETPETQAFSIHLTEVHGRIEGNIAEVDIAERQKNIQCHSIKHTRVDAVFKSGKEQSFTPSEWEEMAAVDRDQFASWTRHFDESDLRSVHLHLDHLCEQTEAACRQVSVSEFLVGANAAYMKQAQCPQEDMLRISQPAAKEMLARGDADIYRLLPTGAEKLSPTDAVRSGLWFSEHREFAIRREDMAGLQKWAERSTADAISRATAHDEHKKTNGPEL